MIIYYSTSSANSEITSVAPTYASGPYFSTVCFSVHNFKFMHLNLQRSNEESYKISPTDLSVPCLKKNDSP